MTQQTLNIVIGASQYDCAECAAANMLAPPVANEILKALRDFLVEQINSPSGESNMVMTAEHSFEEQKGT